MAIEATLDDGAVVRHDALALLENLNPLAQKLAVGAAIRLAYDGGKVEVVPPTAGGMAWLIERVAAVEGVEPARVRRVAAVVMLDELSIYTPRPRVGSTEVLREVLYERSGDTGAGR